MSVMPTVTSILKARGIPHRRVEDWKYSDLRGAYESLPVKTDWHAGLSIQIANSIEMVGVAEERLPDWVSERLASLAHSSAMDDAARSLMNLGDVLRVPSGSNLEWPITIEHFGHGHGATVVFVEAGASVSIKEGYSLHGRGFSNTSFLMFLDEGAKAVLSIDAPFASGTVVVETVSVLQARNSRFTARVLNGGAKLSRTELNIILNGEGAEANLSGVTVLGDEAHADITTRITHAAPHTTSRQLFKKIAGGKSRAVYQGKISVREGAIGSDSRQTAKALLLSDRAEADLKPELEILADDVKCAHGAAVGELDQDSLFYLRSRGIPEEEARSLLIRAFLQEVVDGIENKDIQEAAAQFIDRGLVQAMRGTS